MAYNFDKDTCDKCNRKAKSRNRALTYQEQANDGLRLSINGSVLCSDCSREKNLEYIFNKLDENEEVNNSKT